MLVVSTYASFKAAVGRRTNVLIGAGNLAVMSSDGSSGILWGITGVVPTPAEVLADFPNAVEVASLGQ